MIVGVEHHDASGLFDEMIVDNFAGGGGASHGIERALGRAVDVAINHDRKAVAMHRINHPATYHYCEDVWKVDPMEVTAGRPVGLAWFSPDCKHFSRAKGGKPVSKKIRGLAWVVILWATRVRPRVIMLENVEEFQTWGPIGEDGRPCPERKGVTFRSWVGQLRKLGYDVQWRPLRACDYGAPTIRKRLFLVARCDGQPINWPEVTHGPNREVLQKVNHRPVTKAGEDFTTRQRLQGKSASHHRLRRIKDISCSSVRQNGGSTSSSSPFKPYRTAAECIDWSRPCPSIFERKKPLAENTLRRIANGIRRYVIEAVEPFIVTNTIHTLVTTGYGERPASWKCSACGFLYDAVDLPTCGCVKCGSEADPVEIAGQAPRVPGLNKPLGTVVAGGQKHALVSAFLTKHYSGVVGSPLTDPIHTITAKDHNALTAAYLLKLRGTCRDGQPVTEPMPTITAGGNHVGEVRALLIKYYGNDKEGVSLRDPMHTVTTKDRIGLVMVHGEPYQIADIGMRMLRPRELYRAQGFDEEYVIERGVDEDGNYIPMTKSDQVRMCGNSVCPPMAEAIVRANCTPMIAKEINDAQSCRHHN